MKRKKKRNIGKEIIKGLQEFAKVLESGEPLENHFRVTTIERVNAWEVVRTVTGPKENMSNLNGKRLKELVAKIPDDASIDLILQDANGGGVDAPDIVLGSEMGTDTALVVQLPAGYFLTTKNPAG